MATAEKQGVSLAKAKVNRKKESKKTSKTESPETTNSLTDLEEKHLTDDADSGNVPFNNAATPQPHQETITMAIKKTDSEGYMIDTEGKRVTTSAGELIRLRVPKQYNDAGQQIDENGVVVLGKNGQPKTRPVRDLGQKVIAKKLRAQIEACNAILDLAKSKGIVFEVSFDGDATPPLSLGEMQIVEKL